MTEKPSPERIPRILCIDSNHGDRILYSKFLKDFNCRLEIVESAREGFNLLKSFQPDLIISELDTTVQDGYDFCRDVKTQPAYSGIVFIFTTTDIHNEDTLKGIDAGADGYLHKPFGKEEFLAKTRAFLRIKFLQDDLSRTNRKLKKAVLTLKNYKSELEEKNIALIKEKEIIQNSLKQISLMADEREKTNKELERLNEIRQHNIDGLVSILTSFIESKRQYHRGHSKKVADISTFMARELGLPETTIRHIETAALLHELGKLTIPDELAMKNPEAYTQQEKDYLAQHPVRGAAVFDQFSGFEEISEIIRHFHENFDGTGSPDGLEGNDIPIGARIIAVANLFDNLAFRRKDIQATRVFEIIEEQLGLKFDPLLGSLIHKYAHTHPVDDSIPIRELRLLELEPGMELAAGIYTTSGTKLLPIGSVLTQTSIDRIIQYSRLETIVETVYVKS